jgi:hypothetical protein
MLTAAALLDKFDTGGGLFLVVARSVLSDRLDASPANYGNVGVGYVGGGFAVIVSQ